MVSESIHDHISSLLSGPLAARVSAGDVAALSARENFTPEQLDAVAKVVEMASERKSQDHLDSVLRRSGLPAAPGMTFDNFDFGNLHGRDAEDIRTLMSVSEAAAGLGIGLIGPTGVGKTHLAQAYGRRCCESGISTLYLPWRALGDRLGKVAAGGASWERLRSRFRSPRCLILDAVGDTPFDAERTQLFRALVSVRCDSPAVPRCTIVTTRTQPAKWSCFLAAEGEDIAATVDLLFDSARIINIKGSSYRGRSRVILAASTDPAPASERRDP